MGFYVLVIFDFDGDLNGIPCLFCWVYKAPSLWQSLRTSSQSAEAKLDDLPADLEIKIRFLFKHFYSGFHRDFSNEEKGRYWEKITGYLSGMSYHPRRLGTKEEDVDDDDDDGISMKDLQARFTFGSRSGLRWVVC